MKVIIKVDEINLPANHKMLASFYFSNIPEYLWVIYSLMAWIKNEFKDLLFFHQQVIVRHFTSSWPSSEEQLIFLFI